MNKQFTDSFSYKLIYIFTIDDNKHKGLLKIGDATLKSSESIENLPPNCKLLNQAAKNRIKSYTNTAGIDFTLLHTELAVRTNQDGIITAFRDHDVHAVLKNSDISPVKVKGSTAKEWFRISLETAKNAIKAVKDDRVSLLPSETSIKFTPVVFRPEQLDAINATVKQFRSGNRMLWNAKMRFGKTLSALEVVRKIGFAKTMIVTHRPVVNHGWYENFGKIFHNKNEYHYGSKNRGDTIEFLILGDKKFIYFASIQDLRGSDTVGGKFSKNTAIFNTEWDCVIVDEAHEGTTTALGEEVIKSLVKENTKFLALSGTPFNILGDYDSNVYTWDYIMEQRAKAEWDLQHFGDSNPYDELPKMNIFVYDLGKLLGSRYVEIEDKAFNFHEFFRTWTGDIRHDFKAVPSEAKIGDFVHEKDVLSFLNLITKESPDSQYPYATKEYRNLFRHSLWIVPGVKEAKALSRMLKSHPIFSMFKIVNVAGDGDEEEKSDTALKKVRDAISDAGIDGYTITLSCGKLTTGVTVREWTAVFMLAGTFSTSASSYLQTIFRVQSPCNQNGKIKDNCYVFDFAPDRTLKMVAESVALSTKAGKTSESDRKIMGEFLNYCPVIAIDGTVMKKYDTNRLLQQLKRAYAERAVQNGFDDTNLYNDELLKLSELELKEFDKLKGIIGSSKAQQKTKEIDINHQGFTDEEYQETQKIQKKPKTQRTPEEQAKLDELEKQKKNRGNAISILRGISIRMPLMIYGADIAIDEDFTIDKFLDNSIIDEASWTEFMPKGVTREVFQQFIKYYDEDIFIAAGRKIRNLVKGADDLNPTERIKQIAQLFSCFKNPDKETVLTPWRVVNMHMSDCLGGYSFYEENPPVNAVMLETPRFVDCGQVTSETFGNPEAHILEINSKTGLYPLYVVYSIFRTRCQAFSADELTLEKQNALWKETVEKNIFVICQTPMAKQITKRTLVGYRDISVNAHYFDDLINTMQNKQKNFVEKVLKPSYWHRKGDKMEFDAVVGNPPYQLENQGNNNGKDPIYHLFIDAGRSVCKFGTFIHPARFLFNAGKTPKEWNEKILNDEHFKVIAYWSDCSEVFPTVDIKGGIAVTMWDSTKKFEPIEAFTAFPELNQIKSKASPKSIAESLVSIIFNQMKFNLDELYAVYPEYENVIGSNGKDKRFRNNIFDKIPLFQEEKTNDTDIPVYGLIKNKRVWRYFPKKFMDLDHENLFKWKVLVPRANGTGAIGEVVSTPLVGEPLVSYTQSFIGIGAFDTQDEAENCMKYVKTKFARALLGILKITQDNPPEKWRFVPVQNFTADSDIDWSVSVPEIDRQLYAKYGLTDEEIEFIESMIKPME